MTKYHNLRLQFGMYLKMENILAELLLLVVQEIDYELCMFRQAHYLLSFIHTQIKRMDSVPDLTVDTDKFKLLKQLTIITESLYLAVNLQKSYQMMKEGELVVFIDKYEKFKAQEVEEVDLPIQLARNQAELQTHFEKLSGFKSEVNKFMLSTVFDGIKTSIQFTSFYFD